MAGRTIDAPLHAQKTVEKLQSELGTAKDKVLAEAKAPAVPRDQPVSTATPRAVKPDQ